MKKLLIELKAHVHLAFKRYCIEKNTSMKTELTKYILAVVKSTLNMTNDDVIKGLIQNERKIEYENALKKYREKRQKRIEKKKSAKHWERKIIEFKTIPSYPKSKCLTLEGKFDEELWKSRNNDPGYSGIRIRMKKAWDDAQRAYLDKKR
ncbi:hypothetical protein LCGC14_1542970 [marine sediment metagenome]|uniref:Uncharacterized protein n=1 Tax=marine sediment metagenome TaxID=412755 RepID=A0A0F9ISK6_9ZZZZ